MDARTLGPCTAKHYAWALQSHGGDPHTVIRVQNLSTKALVGGAVWGVQEGARLNHLQPILLSTRLSLRRPFMSAAESDEVNDSTINYSTLSKEILKIIGSRQLDVPHSDEFVGLQMDWSLYDLLAWLEVYLTGVPPSGRKPPFHTLNSYIEGGVPCLEEKRSNLYIPPFLDIRNLLEVGFTVFLPKATLLSEGVSLTTSTLYSNRKVTQQFGMSFSVLKIHNIRIPTLIGINPKERLAKQMVVVSVEIDPYVCTENDCYDELEQIIVKTTEESSFQTLESLAILLSSRVIKYFIYAYTPFLDNAPRNPDMPPQGSPYSQVCIRLEKPCAIPFADAPSIEVTRTSSPYRDEDARKLHAEWEQCVKRTGRAGARVPFPLQGTLSSWIALQETFETPVKGSSMLFSS